MIEYVHAFVWPAAMALLPPALDSLEARAHVLAIGDQESRYLDRRQVVDGGHVGPARGFWQFELAGVAGVLTHPRTKPLVLEALERLRYVPAASACYEALEHNDALACVFARLNLYWLPGRMPRRDQADKAWRQYVEGWRPGAPHPARWPACWERAWQLVAGPVDHPFIKEE